MAMVILAMMLTLASLQIAYAAWDEAEVYESNLKMYALNNRTEQYLLDFCTKPSLYIESDDPKIVNLSRKITSGINNDYDKAKAIY